MEPISSNVIYVVFEKNNPEIWNTDGRGIQNPVKGAVLAKTYEDGTIRYNILNENGQPGADSDLARTDINDTIRAQYIQSQRAAQQNPPISPEQRAAEATTAGAQARAATALDAERAQNAANGDGYVTNADLAKQKQEQADAAVRLQQVNAQIASIQAQAQSTADTNAIRREEMGQRAGEFGVTSAQTDRQISQGDERIGIDKEKVGIDREELGIKREQVGLQGRQVDIQESQNTFEQGPKFELEKTKQAFAEKQAQLSNLLAARRIDQETAIAEMNNWWRANVEGPFKMDEAARMRSAEERQLQQLEDSSAQFAATHSLNRARLGVDAGHYAVQEEEATFPYRGGPNLGANFSSAINSLAKGSSAGVNFGPDDFNFTANIDKTRERATAKALEAVSPYARNIVMQNEGRTQTPLPSVDWGSMPSLGSQPTAVTDFIQQYYPGMIAPDKPEEGQ